MDDDTQHRRLYNVRVMQAAVADPRSRESARAARRMPPPGLAALAAIAILGMLAVPFGAGSDLESHRTGPFTFEAPAAWSVREARAAWTGGSSHAVLGTVPIPSRCGSGNVEINCYYALKPPPSSVSIVLLTSSPLLQTDDIDDYVGRIRSEGVRTRIGGLEAYRIEQAIAENEYYRSDLAVSWVVPQPAHTGSFWIVEAKVRGPGAEELMRDVWRFVGSMRIAP